MRNLTFLAPLAVAVAVAGAAMAQPAAITVTVGPDLQEKVEELGSREVQEQIDRLTQVLTRDLASAPGLEGAKVDLVLTELKPNRPTRQQMIDRPGLDPMRSVSIGGASFAGQVTLADGTVQPIRYDWFSNNISDVRGFTTWQDADRAYRRLATNLAAGRYARR
jgi:hypothetical protein